VEVIDSIKDRRSIRAFDKDKEITDDEINVILDAAKWYPSARNIQPIEFIVIRDKDIREKLAEVSNQIQPKIAPVCIVVIADMNREWLIGEISPHDTTTSDKGINIFMYMDAGAAIQNLMLAAHSLGIGSLWISAFDAGELRKIVKVPKHYKTLAIICLGQYSHKPRAPPKRNLDEMVHFDKFTQKKYDNSYLEFSRNINAGT